MLVVVTFYLSRFRPLPTTDNSNTDEEQNITESAVTGNIPVNLTAAGHRLSTGCLMSNPALHGNIRREDLSLSDLNLPIHAWI